MPTIVDSGDPEDLQPDVYDGGDLEVQRPTQWTRDWYRFLPASFRGYDAVMSPAYPLLRFMDGPGFIAARLRAISDQLWDGTVTNPERTPDGAVRWLAMMMGVPPGYQSGSVEDLRSYMLQVRGLGVPPVGTRQGLVVAARQEMKGDDPQVIVAPSTTPHTIRMLVRLDQVPGGNLAALSAAIRARGVVPAGHALVVTAAASSWAQWEAVAGQTWADKEANIRTWADSDSAGVAFE